MDKNEFMDILKCHDTIKLIVTGIGETVFSTQEIAEALERVRTEPCEWCNAEYTIIDDDFGQPLHSDFITHCFHCGRKLDNKKV